MTVFIICKPKPGGVSGNTYDVSPATEYGTLRFIFDSYENPSSRPVEALEKIRNIFEDFNEAEDYIVWSGGDPLALLLTGYVLYEKSLPIKYLRFERLRTRPEPGANPAAVNQNKSGYYVPVPIPQSAH